MVNILFNNIISKNRFLIFDKLGLVYYKNKLVKIKDLI